MRNPAADPPTGAAGIVAVALMAIAVLTAGALLLLRSNAVPDEMLDGLTSPARFGQRTT